MKKHLIITTIILIIISMLISCSDDAATSPTVDTRTFNCYLEGQFYGNHPGWCVDNISRVDNLGVLTMYSNNGSPHVRAIISNAIENQRDLGNYFEYSLTNNDSEYRGAPVLFIKTDYDSTSYYYSTTSRPNRIIKITNQ